MKHARALLAIAICSLLLNGWLGYGAYRSEVRNRQALAYSAQLVAYRLTQLTTSADGLPATEWAEISRRAWIYDSVKEIVDHGRAAEKISTRGRPAEVSRKLGELARRFELYYDDAHRLAFSGSAEDRVSIQKLAQAIRAAGWGPPEEAGKPVAWTYGRDWTELDRTLAELLKALP